MVPTSPFFPVRQYDQIHSQPFFFLDSQWRSISPLIPESEGSEEEQLGSPPPFRWSLSTCDRESSDRETWALSVGAGAPQELAESTLCLGPA